MWGREGLHRWEKPVEGTGSAGEKASHGETSKQGQRARHQEKLGSVSLASDLRMGQRTYPLTFSP